MIISLKSFGQNIKKIEIINADKTFANNKLHPNYWRLIGNISFKHDQAVMYCDSAYHYINENRIHAFGNIKIVQKENILITGEQLIYIAKKSQADISKNVILKDEYLTLESQNVLYNLKSNIASYPLNGKITDNKKTIKSKKGTYYRNINKFIFQDSVIVIGNDYQINTNKMHYNSITKIADLFGPSFILSNNNIIYTEEGKYNTQKDIATFAKNSYIKSTKYILKADSIYYYKNNHYGEGINNVNIIDTIDNFIISGDYAEYFEQDEIIKVKKKPVLKIISKQDTLFMHAKEFISEQKKIIANPAVKFFKSNLKGKCDSLVYNLKDSAITMYKNPVLWTEESQLTSDTIVFTTSKGNINSMVLKTHPMIIEKVDSIDYNQVKGKKMIGYFKDNQISRLEVTGNGQSIFVINDEIKGKIGLNYVESTNISIQFKNNKLNNVIYKKKPDSMIIPSQYIKIEKRYLNGFIWRKHEAPQRMKDIFIE